MAARNHSSAIREVQPCELSANRAGRAGREWLSTSHGSSALSGAREPTLLARGALCALRITQMLGGSPSSNIVTFININCHFHLTKSLCIFKYMLFMYYLLSRNCVCATYNKNSRVYYA